MENKEVEKSLNNIREGVDCDGDTNCIKDYIEQLEKEIHSTLGAVRHACSIVVKRENNVKQLEQENEELRQRLIASNAFGRKSNEFRQEAERKLQEKDKALDKAVNELMSYQTLCPPTDYNDLKNEKEWKEWCMNDE